MTNVLVEGSSSPCVHLARGEQRTYVLTPDVQRKIDRGYFIVLRTWEPEGVSAPESVEETDDDVDGAPRRNATREEWYEFVTALDPPIAVWEGATRTEIQQLWDERVEVTEHLAE